MAYPPAVADDLTGQVALVTGGGRGIGANIARELASAGARVAVAARTQSQVEDVARQIDGLAHQRAVRRLAGEQVLLLLEQRGQVRLDPGERAGQRQAIGARVEARRQVQHPVAPARDGVQHQIVDQPRAGDGRPPRHRRARCGGSDGASAVTRQTVRVRIAKQRVRPGRLPRPINGDPARRIGDVRDDRLGQHVSRSGRTPSSRRRARAARRRVLPARPGARRTST